MPEAVPGRAAKRGRADPLHRMRRCGAPPGISAAVERLWRTYDSQAPLSSDYGTCKTVKARFWPFSDKGFYNLLSCSLFPRKRAAFFYIELFIVSVCHYARSDHVFGAFCTETYLETRLHLHQAAGLSGLCRASGFRWIIFCKVAGLETPPLLPREAGLPGLCTGDVVLWGCNLV